MCMNLQIIFYEGYAQNRRDLGVSICVKLLIKKHTKLHKIALQFLVLTHGLEVTWLEKYYSIY